MTPKRQGLTGLFIAVVVALPLFVFSAINVNFNVNKRAEEGEPNFCGGTCGSNYNCQANFFCYEGFCRNPICANEVDCICKAPTPTPTPLKTVKPTTLPTITPEPKGGNLNFEDLPNITPVALPVILPSEPNIVRDPEEQEVNISNQFYARSVPYILAGILLLTGFGFGVFKLKKYMDYDKPHILPPTNI